MLLKNQIHAAPQRGLPVDDKGSSSSIVSVTGETVQFYYSNSGVLTIDAGQAAGVAVTAQLAYNNVKNALGNLEATKSDTSLSFTSTAFTSEVYVDFEQIENLDATTFANRLSTITSGFSNGQYCVDYSNGTLYGVKASTQTSLASAAYKYQANSVGSVSTAITSVIPGTGATNLGKAEDAAHASGDTGVAMLAKRTDTAASSAGTDGDYATVNQDSLGHAWSREGYAAGAENNTDGVIFNHQRAVSSVTGAGTDLSSTALEASKVLKASPGRLYWFSGYIDATAPTATYYLQFFNLASVPADATAIGASFIGPIAYAHVTGTPTPIDVDFSVFGVYGSTGLVCCLSSTQFTKTITAAYLCVVNSKVG